MVKKDHDLELLLKLFRRSANGDEFGVLYDAEYTLDFIKEKNIPLHVMVGLLKAYSSAASHRNTSLELREAVFETFETAKEFDTNILIAKNLIGVYSWNSDIYETNSSLKNSTCKTMPVLKINGYGVIDVKRLTKFYHSRSRFEENSIDLSDAVCRTLVHLHKEKLDLNFVTEREKQLKIERRIDRLSSYQDEVRVISSNYSGFKKNLMVVKNWYEMKMQEQNTLNSLGLCDLIIN